MVRASSVLARLEPQAADPCAWWVEGGGWRVRGWAGTGSGHGIHRNQRPIHESVGLWKDGVFEMLSLRGRHKATMTFKMKGL